jgi:hypothetical protein
MSMGFTDDIEQALLRQEAMIDFSMVFMLLLTILAVAIVFSIARVIMVSDKRTRRESIRNMQQIDRMNDNLRQVKHGMEGGGYSRQSRHRAVSEITDSYFVGESKDLKRIEQIKLMLSASSLFDGSKNQKLVDELKILEDNRKFHGINIVIKDRLEDDYRKPEKIVKGDKDDDTLVSYK